MSHHLPGSSRRLSALLTISNVDLKVAEREEPLGNHRKIQISPKHVVLCRKVIPERFSVKVILEIADDGSFILMCVANYHVVDRACFSLNVSSSGRATKLG